MDSNMLSFQLGKLQVAGLQIESVKKVMMGEPEISKDLADSFYALNRAIVKIDLLRDKKNG